jgi:hypothetical protein
MAADTPGVLRDLLHLQFWIEATRRESEARNKNKFTLAHHD